MEPAQFGNPAERRLLEIPDARVCTVHCLCDRKVEHFRSSNVELPLLLMPFARCMGAHSFLCIRICYEGKCVCALHTFFVGGGGKEKFLCQLYIGV